MASIGSHAGRDSFSPCDVLSRLFRRLFLDKFAAAHAAGRLNFFGDHAALADAQTFTAYLAPLRKTEWVVYAKRPFGGPGGAGLSVPLYAPRRHRQQPLARARPQQRHLQVEGLPQQRIGAIQRR